MKIVSLAAIVLPGASASYGVIEMGQCEAPITTEADCNNAAETMVDPKTGKALRFASTSAWSVWPTGCVYRSVTRAVYWNTKKTAHVAGNDGYANPALVCLNDKHVIPAGPVHDMKFEGFCDVPVETFEECQEASFQLKRIPPTKSGWLNWPTGCIGREFGGDRVYWNEAVTTVEAGDGSADHPSLICGRKKFPDKCNPKECDQWTCKNWCKCFKAHPEIVEIFEGPNPSASEQAIRDSCPSDGKDDCDCTEFYVTTTITEGTIINAYIAAHTFRQELTVEFFERDQNQKMLAEVRKRFVEEKKLIANGKKPYTMPDFRKKLIDDWELGMYDAIPTSTLKDHTFREDLQAEWAAGKFDVKVPENLVQTFRHNFELTFRSDLRDLWEKDAFAVESIQDLIQQFRQELVKQWNDGKFDAMTTTQIQQTFRDEINARAADLKRKRQESNPNFNEFLG